MKTASKFRVLRPQGRQVRVLFAGEELALIEGENLAAALLAAGVAPFRHTPVSGAPRSPFCMMGACFDCLVDVGGVTRQACMMQVEEGLIITMPAAGEWRHA